MSSTVTCPPALAEREALWHGLPLCPLRVTLEVEGALGGMAPPHFDALLAYQVLQEAGLLRRSDPRQELYRIPLPLACLWRDPQRDLPLWAVTDIQPVAPLWYDTEQWQRFQAHSALIVLGRHGEPYAPKVGKGPDKVVSTGLPVTIAAAWTCDVVGHAETIARLLAPLSHTGKKRAQGWGVIRRWTLQPLARWSLVDQEQRLRRVLPVEVLRTWPAAEVQFCTWTPPYWSGVPATQAICLPRGVHLEASWLAEGIPTSLEAI